MHGVKILVVWLLIAACILTLSYHDPAGMLGHDSVYYLRMARNLLHGIHPMFIAHRFGGDLGYHVAMWPVGYPALMAGVSRVLPVDLFLASKLVTVLMVGLACYALHRVAGRLAWIYAAVFLVAPVLNMAARTISEISFVALLVLYILALHAFYRSSSAAAWIGITICPVGLFVLRYIGLYAVGLLGILGLVLLIRRQIADVARCAVSAVITVAVAVAYLLYNRSLTGHMTGRNRLEYHETLPEVLRAVTTAHVQHLNLVTSYGGIGLIGRLVATAAILLTAAVLVRVVLRARRDPSGDPDGENQHLFLFFLVAAVTYWMCIMAIIAARAVGPFDYARLILPALPLLLFAGLCYLQFNVRVLDREVRWLMLIPCASVLLGTVILPAYAHLKGTLETFAMRSAAVRESYATLTARDGLISDNYLVMYLRPDIGFLYYYGSSLDGLIPWLRDSGAEHVYLDLGRATPVTDDHTYEQVEGFARPDVADARLYRVQNPPSATTETAAQDS